MSSPRARSKNSRVRRFQAPAPSTPTEDGSVSVEAVQYKLVGVSGLLASAGSSPAPRAAWVLDAFSSITADVDGDTAVVGVIPLSDYACSNCNVSQIVQPEVLMLHLMNAGALNRTRW